MFFNFDYIVYMFTKKIKIMMIEKELTGQYLATRIGVSRQAISQIINGVRKSAWIRKAIEDILETPIWSDTHNSDSFKLNFDNTKTRSDNLDPSQASELSCESTIKEVEVV